MIEAYLKNSSKGNWATPLNTMSWILDNIPFEPKIDVCVSSFEPYKDEFNSLQLPFFKTNAKLSEYITQEQDFFKTEITKDAFANFPYYKSTKGVKGMDQFFERAYLQHVKNKINFAILAFTIITSTDYYNKFVGTHQKNIYGEKVEIVTLPKRVNFLCRHNYPVGTPAYSSFLILFLKDNIPMGLNL